LNIGFRSIEVVDEATALAFGEQQQLARSILNGQMLNFH
jgi:hypothetical protein